MKIYKNVTNEPYSFLVNETTLSPNHQLHLRKNLTDELYKISQKKNFIITNMDNNHYK